MMAYDVDERMVRRLWDFVTERQEIRARRLAHSKPPWTSDPVLAANHFTNIYREDDPGTLYVTEKLLPVRPLTVVVWNVLWYRMFGKEATWDAFAAQGVVPEATEHAVRRMEEIMREMVDGDGPGPFTTAYMVSNYGRTEDKVTVMCDVMRGAVPIWPDVMQKLAVAARRGVDGRQEAHAALESVHGIGKFVAFQALVDLSYEYRAPDGPIFQRLPFSNDGWATCGPGAQRGLEHIFGKVKPTLWNGCLRELTRRSVGALSARGFDFRIDIHGNEQMLDRANMANCLCEFDKYVRLSAGEGKGRRRSFDAVDSFKRDREARGHGYQYDLERDALEGA